MGILKSGPFGPFYNKTGPIIGRRHRKQNVITSLHHASNKPFTAAQLESQLKLALLNSFLSKIDGLVNMGFKAVTKNNSPVNQAFSYNYDHAFVKDGDSFLINYPGIVYSRGHIDTPESPNVVANPGSITFSWLPQNQSAYCQFTDKASFLVYNPAKQTRIILPNVTNRYAKEHMLEMPGDFIGDPVHCYMNFSSADGKKNGDSMYISSLVVL